jgi:hypothetical protein
MPAQPNTLREVTPYSAAGRVAAIVLLLAGCGGATATSPIVDPASACRVPGTVGFGEYNMAAQERPADDVGAFRRAALADDVAPPSRAGGLLLTVPDDDSANAGRLLHERTRLLFRQHANGLGSLYAAPTSEGWICLVVVNLFPSTCRGKFSWQFIDPGGPGRCAPLQVYGVVADDVTSVSVTVRGIKYEAAMGENAFYFSDPKHDDSADPSVTVHYSDGPTETLP